MSKIVKECPADPIEFLIGKLQAIQRQRRKVSHIHDYKQAFFVHGGIVCWQNKIKFLVLLCVDVVCKLYPVLGFFYLQSASPTHISSSMTGHRSKMQVTGKSVTPKSTATTKGVMIAV